MDLDQDQVSLALAVSADRVFVATAERVAFDWATGTPPPRSYGISAFLVASTGQLQALPTTELGTDAYHFWPNLVARGARAFLSAPNELTVVDTRTPSSPVVTTHEMPGYSCNSLQVSGDQAFCAMGEYGVATFGL